MEKDIKSFLVDKKYSFEFVKHEDIDNYLSDKQTFKAFDSIVMVGDRDVIVAKENNNIVGFASLCRNWEKRFDAIDDVLTLTNIEVKKENRNNGISKILLAKVADHVKENNLILRRTEPTEDGALYIKDSFSRLLKEKDVLTIPNNLYFIYYKLNNDIFSSNDSINDKVKLMNDVAKETIKTDLCKKYDIDNIEKLNSNFIEPAYEIIDKMKNDLRKQKNKLKIK